MNYEEFLKPAEQMAEECVAEEERAPDNTDLTIQKVVVESFAAEKVAQDEKITELSKEKNRLQGEISSLMEKITTMKQALEKVGDILSKNSETELSSKVSLLDRSEELNDRFPGETREHLLEAIREMRDQYERDGRLRRAQLLESILVENQPSGELKKRREELERLFAENQNILSGPVINELDKLGIPYKNGENYLLTSEIIKRNY